MYILKSKLIFGIIDKESGQSSVLDEVEYLYNKGTHPIWFVDSLVNGNLKELKDFLKVLLKEDWILNGLVAQDVIKGWIMNISNF